MCVTTEAFRDVEIEWTYGAARQLLLTFDQNTQYHHSTTMYFGPGDRNDEPRGECIIRNLFE